MAHSTDDAGVTRRDFIYVASAAMAGVGVVAAAWPLIDQMNPAADTLALKEIEVDLTPIVPGQQITVEWRKNPVFVRRRTPEEIKEAQDVPLDELKDPQADGPRVQDSKGVQRPEWLIVVAICTHLGCIPSKDMKGEFGGWLCPCHGSQYDTSGRIRKGPAPNNLAVPSYVFLSDTKVRIG